MPALGLVLGLTTPENRNAFTNSLEQDLNPELFMLPTRAILQFLTLAGLFILVFSQPSKANPQPTADEIELLPEWCRKNSRARLPR